MAKKQKPSSADVWFQTSDKPQYILSNVVYKIIDLKPGALPFLHIERKGNTWFIFNALEMSDPATQELTGFYRHIPGSENPELILDDKPHEISIYTVLHLQSDELWHLDRLPDGTWRTTHTDGLFQPESKLVDHSIKIALTAS